MYLEMFLADFAVFRVFWEFRGISRVRDWAKYQEPWKNVESTYSIHKQPDMPQMRPNP